MIPTLTHSAEHNIQVGTPKLYQGCYPQGQGYMLSINFDFMEDFK
jgi:hypothetical protein